jgi:2',3'-cyclic-nucleotide 2'-phosphodiesterase (5'-nucleotidase family)
MGGIARRASKINSIRQSEGSVIVVDAGGFSPPFGEQAVLKFDAMLVSFLQMGYDVLSVAEPEMRMNAAAGDAWDKLHTLRIPLATLNVEHRGKRIAEKPLIIDRGGVRVAFIAFLVQERNSQEEWTVIDPERLMDDAMRYSRENADFVVAMLWGKSDKIQSFVERHKGMDVVIPAAETGELFEPVRINGSTLFSV